MYGSIHSVFLCSSWVTGYKTIIIKCYDATPCVTPLISCSQLSLQHSLLSDESLLKWMNNPPLFWLYLHGLLKHTCVSMTHVHGHTVPAHPTNNNNEVGFKTPIIAQVNTLTGSVVTVTRII